MKYDSGRHRPRLFRRGAPRAPFLPVSLLILGVLIFLFSLITPSGFFTSINPANVSVPAFTRTPTPLPRPTDVHGGHIVFTCTRSNINQICMINADGSGYEQLTDVTSNAYYPAISPDGEAVAFAVNAGDYFDLDMLLLHVLVAPQASAPKLVQLTFSVGNAFSPTFSPDGQQIAFVNRVADRPAAVWIMGRNGENAHRLYATPRDIVGAAWSPDGANIAFTAQVDAQSTYQVFLLDLHNLNAAPRQVSRGLSGIGGGVAWSPDATALLLFAGPVAAREVYRLDVGSGATTQLTFGGNNAAAAYSPDGQYIVFNSLRNNGQADLYIMRADGHSMRQLTNNPEPDWQPQWGP